MNILDITYKGVSAGLLDKFLKGNVEVVELLMLAWSFLLPSFVPGFIHAWVCSKFKFYRYLLLASALGSMMLSWL
jgi:hypothetical protein